jgi:hypothetical protein
VNAEKLAEAMEAPTDDLIDAFRLALNEAGVSPEAQKPMVAALRRSVETVVTTLTPRHVAYGCENLKRHGQFGITVRMSDKLARIENLQKLEVTHVSDEKLTDTLTDLRGYTLMYEALLNNEL